MQILHSIGIAHMDAQPGNITIESLNTTSPNGLTYAEYKVNLIDYGHSIIINPELFASATFSNQAEAKAQPNEEEIPLIPFSRKKGTLVFASPEMMLGLVFDENKRFNSRTVKAAKSSDGFALGMNLLYARLPCSYVVLKRGNDILQLICYFTHMHLYDAAAWDKFLGPENWARLEEAWKRKFKKIYTRSMKYWLLEGLLNDATFHRIKQMYFNTKSAQRNTDDVENSYMHFTDAKEWISKVTYQNYLVERKPALEEIKNALTKARAKLQNIDEFAKVSNKLTSLLIEVEKLQSENPLQYVYFDSHTPYDVNDLPFDYACLIHFTTCHRYLSLAPPSLRVVLTDITTYNKNNTHSSDPLPLTRLWERFRSREVGRTPAEDAADAVTFELIKGLTMPTPDERMTITEAQQKLEEYFDKPDGSLPEEINEFLLKKNMTDA